MKNQAKTMTTIDHAITCGIDEAAKILRVHRNTALELAEKGEIPGAKIGRAWVFIVADLTDWLRERTREQQRKRRGDDDPPKRTGGGRRQTPPLLPELQNINVNE